MNERIQELIEKATKRYPATDSSGEFSTFDKEKFAELIVQECAQVADQWVNDEDNGQNLVSERLRQHFGVEE